MELDAQLKAALVILNIYAQLEAALVILLCIVAAFQGGCCIWPMR
jgi:hypothetical protein